MSGFFSDNQSKQKAFDRYYNAMARSDFKQSRALKSLIQQQAMDEAQTNSLADLFHQAMFKGREYKYDKITDKLVKGLPSVVKGTSSDKSPKVKVNIIKGNNGRFTKKVASVAADPNVETTPAAPKTPSPIKVKPRTATPQKKRSPAKNFESEDVEMKAPIPTTSPRRSSPQKFPAASYQTPPRRKNAEGFSTKPNILSPESFARHRARVALEEELDAPPPSPPPKYFDDLFGTDGSTADDIAAANAKIDANNDSDSMRKLLERLSKERAASKFSKPGKKSAKVSTDPVTKEKLMSKIAKALNAKKFSYLSAGEKSAAAKQMEAIVEEVSNSPPGKMKSAIDILTTTPRKRADKRPRKVTPPGNIRTDDRGGKSYKQGPQSPNIKRNIYEALADADDEDSDSFDGEIQQEIQQAEHNKMRQRQAADIIERAKTTAQTRRDLKREFGKEINAMIAKRDGHPKSRKQYEWFDREFRKPRKGESLADYQSYAAGMLSGYYMVRDYGKKN